MQRLVDISPVFAAMEQNGTSTCSRQLLEMLPVVDAENIRPSTEWVWHPDSGWICPICESGMPETSADGPIHKREKRFCYYCGTRMK